MPQAKLEGRRARRLRGRARRFGPSEKAGKRFACGQAGRGIMRNLHSHTCIHPLSFLLQSKPFLACV